MSALQPYLFFSGRCEEAIEFYGKALGAQLQMKMLHSESPVPPPPGMLQAGFENKVMHASVKIGDHVLLLSDGCDDKTKFDGFRLALTFSTEDEVRRAFDGLSDGGSVMMPLVQTFWSPLFGMLTDRFGLGWMIMVESK